MCFKLVNSIKGYMKITMLQKIDEGCQTTNFTFIII